MSDTRVLDLEKAIPHHKVTQSSMSSDSTDGESQVKLEEPEQSPPPCCGESNPDSPRNWSNTQKWTTIIIASAFGFVTPMASSGLAPALPMIGKDLAIGDKLGSQMVMSIFVLAYAVGPLLLGPLSEVYGRVWVMQGASTMFLIFNLACGLAQTYPQMLAFRFLAGIGASAPQSLCGGIMADCFNQRERGAALRVYTLAPLLGPAIGPIIGGIISERTTWRWIFWSFSIAMAVVQIGAVFLFRESWEPLVLKAKAKKMQSTVNPSTDASSNFGRDLARNLARATRMLFTQPIIIVVAIYTAYLFGLSYLMLSTFASLYTSPEYYDQSVQNASLHYLALALGYLIGTQATGYFDDWLYLRLKARYNSEGAPELHLPAMAPATIMLPAGLLMYGWCAEAKTHWILPDIAAFIVCAALMSSYYCVGRYVVDAYTKYAASAMAATTTLRSIAGFAFPLFAPAMYKTLNYGWGNSLLAFIAILIGVPAPWLFWVYGRSMRAKSTYAAG